MHRKEKFRDVTRATLNGQFRSLKPKAVTVKKGNKRKNEVKIY
jgi:hypothetical protein